MRFNSWVFRESLTVNRVHLGLFHSRTTRMMTPFVSTTFLIFYIPVEIIILRFVGSENECRCWEMFTELSNDPFPSVSYRRNITVETKTKCHVGRDELARQPTSLWRRGLHFIKNTKPCKQLHATTVRAPLHSKASPWKQPSPKSQPLLADSLTSRWCFSTPQPDCNTIFTTSWPGCRSFPYILLLLPQLHPPGGSEARVQRRVCADIMRRWRQMEVSQPANEELIASFLRGCDLLVQGKGEVTAVVASGAGRRLMALQRGDCGDQRGPKWGHKVQKMMGIAMTFYL